MKKIQEIKIVYRLNDLLVILFFVSFIFAIRPLTGLATILLAANGLLAYKLEHGKWWNPAIINVFTLGLFLLFVMQAVSLLYTRNLHEGNAVFQTKLGMIVLPVGVFYSNMINRESYGRLMRGYIYILFAATVVALIYAAVLFFQHHSAAVFFYHPLVRLYSNHAIQFSVIVFIGLLFLIEEYSRLLFIKNRKGIIFGIIYFSVFLFLLSSKLVIIIYFLYLVYLIVFTGIWVRRKLFRFAGFFILLTLMAVILLTSTPFSERMRQEAGARISLLEQEKFGPGDYFTGVQFRVLSWRFVYEILNEKHAWLQGVGPGDAQDVLNEKYTRENMFTGDLENKTGYLGYHTHNQFLQTVLETGLVGLAFFIMVCIGLVRLARNSGDRSPELYVLLLLCNCFTDAPLKTQYGIILFVFFPLFMFKGRETKEPAH